MGLEPDKPLAAVRAARPAWFHRRGTGLKMLESGNGETRVAGRHFQRTVRCKGLYSSSPECREYCEVAVAWSSGAL